MKTHPNDTCRIQVKDFHIQTFHFVNQIHLIFKNSTISISFIRFRPALEPRFPGILTSILIHHFYIPVKGSGFQNIWVIFFVWVDWNSHETSNSGVSAKIILKFTAISYCKWHVSSWINLGIPYAFLLFLSNFQNIATFTVQGLRKAKEFSIATL